MSNKLDCLLQLYSLQTQLQKTIDRHLSLHGISLSEFFILYYLDSSDTKTMRRIDLAEHVGLSASGITRALNPLEKIGLVEKEINPRDARVSLVKLSKTGEKLFKDTFLTMMSSSESLLANLNNEEVSTLLSMLKKI